MNTLLHHLTLLPVQMHHFTVVYVRNTVSVRPCCAVLGRVVLAIVHSFVAMVTNENIIVVVDNNDVLVVMVAV